ncbi:hypothetical protein [Neobacillus drentensis]|uniref:hypothetical protein n=1 Tax=Neobacillus drentensis TaxID=220684 RepID=UPI002858F670|nr:hypothetical protein [Neobacillus drentensis]MDR7235712.1 hypothetical protein [Neobacillus drentensis]
MIQQQRNSAKQVYGKLYNFVEYKKHKPYFDKPMKITIGSPLNETYYLIKNLVYRGKQILAMKEKQDSNTIILVEAKIRDGQLIHISKLSAEYLGAVSGMLGRKDAFY